MQKMSNSQWYFEKHGKAEGPVSTHDIVCKIEDGDLNLLDLVFKEGDGQWSPIESFSEITELVKTAATQFLPDSDWIVLRTVNVDGREQREQVGPFTIEQVLQLIDKGRLKFTDYAWRTGYENWVPLGQVGEFEAPLLSSIQVDKSLYEKPQQKDLQNEELKKAKNYKPALKLRMNEEEAPPEAKGEDLTKPGWMISSRKTKKEKSETVQPVVNARNASPLSTTEQPLIQENLEDLAEKKIEKVAAVHQRWQTVASVAVLFIFLFGGGIFLIYGKKAYDFYKDQQERISFEPTASDIKVVPKPVRNQPSLVPTPQSEIVSSKTPLEQSVPVETKKVFVPEPQKTQNIVSREEKNKKNDEKVKEAADLFMEAGTPKQKSYFVNNERLYLFYNAQKGLRFIAEIEKIIKKPTKKKQPVKPLIAPWLKQVKSFYSQTEMEAKAKRLHPQLYKKLNAITKQLWNRGIEIETSLVNGRGLAKDLSFSEIVSDYKKLAKSAQAID
jgi:hypothetical protein